MQIQTSREMEVVKASFRGVFHLCDGGRTKARRCWYLFNLQLTIFFSPTNAAARKRSRRGMALTSPSRGISFRCITSEYPLLKWPYFYLTILVGCTICLPGVFQVCKIFLHIKRSNTKRRNPLTTIEKHSGTLASNGQKFDASRDRGRPFQFVIGIGQVIKGWDEGVMQMSLGEKAMLRITSDYGYGPRGAGGVIPPNADLNFEGECILRCMSKRVFVLFAY